MAWHLEAEGYTTILDVWELPARCKLRVGDARGRPRQHVYHRCALADYLAALYTQPEWAAASLRIPSGTQRRLLPVRVRACTLRGLLRPLLAIDLVALDEERAHEALLSGVRRERTKPPTPPRFPGGAPQTVGEAPGFPGVGPLGARGTSLPS